MTTNELKYYINLVYKVIAKFERIQSYFETFVKEESINVIIFIALIFKTCHCIQQPSP